MDITERFLKYTQFDTQSSEESQTVPSTSKQLIFAKYLKEELEREGMSDVEMDEQGYIYATLKANTKKNIPTIGFISHYDTSPDCSGANIRPRIVENYDGSDIVLSEGIVSSPTKFPELKAHIGEDIIVTDGTTLLGADDKAGIAEIVQAMCWLRDHDEVEHGDIRIGFNPDEEIGMGAHHFNVEKFGCEWAYTIDGGDLGELEYENFNAAGAKVNIKGVSVHTGYAKGKMVNASRLAVEFAEMIPATDTPEETEGYEGFYHLLGINSCCEKATLSYIIRDHDREKFERRKDFIEECVRKMNEKWGEGTDRPEHARHRHCAEGNAGKQRCSEGAAHPWRYRRCAAIVQGSALPQHLRRRLQLPWSSRVRERSGDGEGYAGDHQDLRADCPLQRLSVASRQQRKQFNKMKDSPNIIVWVVLF